MDSIELLKKINWNGLSCFERALCFASLPYNPNSIYAFLLLKMQLRNFFENNDKYSIGSDEYYHKLLSILGLDFVRKHCFKDFFIESLNEDLNKGNNIIVCTNIYDYKETKDYKKKHHPHFTFIKEIKEDYITIIDEDWTKNYWKKENAQNGVTYLEKTIKKDNLQEYSQHYYKCLPDGDITQRYYIVVYSRNTKKSSKSDIFNYYKNGLLQIKDVKNFFWQIGLAVDIFYSNFEEYIKSLNPVNKKNAVNSEFEMKNRYIYPKDLEIVACHHFFIDSQFQAFNLLLGAEFVNNSLYTFFNNTLKEFNILKLLIAKDIFDTMPNHKNYLIQQAQFCSKLESELYNEIIKVLNNLINKKLI